MSDGEAGPPGGTWVPGNDWRVLDGEQPEPLPSVSVVIVHHEQERELQRTLHALSRQTYPTGLLEIIVVDDGSRRPPAVPAGVKLVRQPRQGARRSAARNRGVAESAGAIICFLDADTAPEPEYLAALVRLPALAPEAVAVGTRHHADFTGVPIDAELARAGRDHALIDPAWLTEGYARSEHLRHADARSFRLVISAVLACSRWFFEETGGFDESFTDYGGEDWEWAYRAWLNGAVFAHVPHAVAWHDGPEWSDRAAEDPGGRLRAKSAEAIRLSGLLTVSGHAPHGLLTPRPETLVALPDGLEPAAAFICVDSLLQALPQAVVRVQERLLPLFGSDPRILPASRLETSAIRWAALDLILDAPVRVTGSQLRELCATVRDQDMGVIRVRDAAGTLLRLENRRHARRMARWGPRAGLGEVAVQANWAQRLGPGADVEAYLGGWTRSGREPATTETPSGSG